MRQRKRHHLQFVPVRAEPSTSRIELRAHRYGNRSVSDLVGEWEQAEGRSASDLIGERERAEERSVSDLIGEREQAEEPVCKPLPHALCGLPMHPTRAGFPIESFFLVEADPPGVVWADVFFEHRRELLRELVVFDDDAVFGVV